MGPLVRAAVLTNYFEVAKRLDLDTRPLLRKAGLAPAMLGDPDLTVPSSAVVTLLEDSARASDCPTFGIQMAETRQLSDLGAVGLLLTYQRTLREALHTMVEYRHLVNEALALQIEEADGMVIVRQEVVTDQPAPARQATELALGVLYRMCVALFGSRWRPQSVNFSHEPPPSMQVHRRVFGASCKLEFSSDFNGFVLVAEDLEQQNPAADPAMARYAKRFIESLPGANERSLGRDVRKAIHVLLPTGRATIEQVAQGLGLNVRTLQRQLGEAGLTFSDLVDEVRRDLALRYMENPDYSLARIGELLGYSMPSSFTRWFSTQFGEAPARWRANRKTARDAD